MRRRLLFSIVMTLVLVGSSALSAQQRVFGVEEGEEVQPPLPVRVVAEFLALSEEQLSLWVELREETQPQLEMLGHEVKALEHRLQEELESEEPAAPMIGVLVLEIRARRAQFETIFRTRAEDFAEALDDEQRERLFLIHRAAQLQPLLPAFRQFGLLP